MEHGMGLDLGWWVAVVEVPALAGLFWLSWRTRREAEAAAAETRRAAEAAAAALAARLAEFKLEVAKGYVSVPYLKDVESRLTAHLLRIEKKLDGRTLAGGGRDA